MGFNEQHSAALILSCHLPLPNYQKRVDADFTRGRMIIISQVEKTRRQGVGDRVEGGIHEKSLIDQTREQPQG